MDKILRPLKFDPIFKQVLWGGHRISDFKGLEPVGGPVGESWEISGLEGHESIISGGQFKGISINALLQDRGKEIMGQRLYGRYGNRFPLLVKFIDAAQDLSIQVHPNDRIASRLHNCNGKTELWYMLDPEGKAMIYTGFESPISKDDFKSHVENNTLCDVLSRLEPKRGDLFYLPAGRIHSIGAGNFLLEIQQTSDITYRVYDYNRTDLNGKKRELHVDLAMEAIDYDVHKEYNYRIEPRQNEEVVINRCGYFIATLIEADESVEVPVAEKDSFRIIVITKGVGRIDDGNGRPISVRQGETVLVPAVTRSVEIIPRKGGFIEAVTAYVP